MQNDPFLTIKQNFHVCQFSHFAVLKYNIILKKLQEIYQACKCRCTLRYDPDKCRHSRKGLTRTRLCLVHSVGPRSLEHSYR